MRGFYVVKSLQEDQGMWFGCCKVSDIAAKVKSSKRNILSPHVTPLGKTLLLKLSCPQDISCWTLGTMV